MPFQITSACLGPFAEPQERASLLVQQLGTGDEDDDDEDEEEDDEDEEKEKHNEQSKTEEEEGNEEDDDDEEDDGNQIVLTTLACGVNEHANLNVMLEGSFVLTNMGAANTDIHVLGHVVVGSFDEHDHEHNDYSEDDEDEDDETWLGRSLFLSLSRE